MADLDPRWEWLEVAEFGQRDPTYIRGRCRHLDTVPVQTIVDHVVVAQLCLTCDAQLPV